MEKRAPITIKEKAFVKEYVQTGNATEAASRVYDVSSRHSAEQIGHENLRKLEISDYLEAAGLTNENIAQIIVNATKATKLEQAHIFIHSLTGDRLKEFMEWPDWNTRLKALLIAIKLKNIGKPESPQPSPIFGGLSIISYADESSE